jgi:hypothetical protein
MQEPELKLVPAEPASPWPKLVVAAAVMIVVAIAVFLLNPRKTADIKIVKTEVFAPHTVFKSVPGSMHVVGTAPAAEDDLYVVATISITDKLRLPLFINEFTAVIVNPDGTMLNGTPIAPRDLARLETTFPDLSPMAAKPIDDSNGIAPGETRKGAIVLQFPGLTAAAWNTKKSASLTVNLIHQQPQTIDLH